MSYPIIYRTLGSGSYVIDEAGENLGAHKLVYRGPADTWLLADADAVASMPVIGLTLAAIGAGLNGRILFTGYVGDAAWAWTTGGGAGKIYASTTPGELTQTAPVGAGDVVQVVAVAFFSTGIWFDPAGLGGGGISNTLEGETAFVGFDATKSGFVNYFLADGIADNGTIQAALDYIDALAGGVVFLEIGDYVLDDPLQIGSFTELRGASKPYYNVSVSSLRLANGVDDNLIENKVAAVSVRVTDLHLNGNSANQTAGDGINLDAGNSIISGCYLNQIFNDGIVVRNGINWIYGNRGQNIGNDFISVNGADTIVYNNIGTATNYGVLLSAANIECRDNLISLAGVVGIFADSSGDNCHIINNRVNDCVTNGIENTGTDSVVSGNRCIDNGQAGILQNVADGVISGNHCLSNGRDGILILNNDANSVTGNVCRLNVRNGINVDDSDNNVITSNECNENDSGATGNFDGIKITDTSSDNLVQNNICNTNGGYGINIDDANALRNWIKNNQLRNNTTGIFSDVGTGTKLAMKPYQFTEAINGEIIATSPTGIDVDATTEAALAWGQLPIELQQAVRLKIWAVATDAPIGAGGQMHLEVTFNAGASNAAYNEAGKSWNIVNFDGEEVDYVANDVVHWVIEDGDVGNELLSLVAGDSFEIFAMWETDADPDGATDALFRVVEVEYV